MRESYAFVAYFVITDSLFYFIPIIVSTFSLFRFFQNLQKSFEFQHRIREGKGEAGGGGGEKPAKADRDGREKDHGLEKEKPHRTEKSGGMFFFCDLFITFKNYSPFICLFVCLLQLPYCP